MSPQAESPAPGFGLYLHVPFCATRCDFCAFYEEQPSRAQVKAFLEALETEFARAPACPRSAVEVPVFVGGGTPTLLTAADLDQLCAITRAWLGGRPREWTVEMAPSTVKADKLAALREGGVTRASLGVQSFRDPWLAKLGRRQSVAQAEQAYAALRAAQFPSVNLDLMFALPGQTEAEWRVELETAIAWNPDHLSTYCLTPEEDTALWAKMAAGQHRRDEAQEAALYQATWTWLNLHGLPQYEVSNFARPGHTCQHNLNVWAMGEWLGLGPSAASQFGGWRTQNPSSLTDWAAAVAKRPFGVFPAEGHEQSVCLSAELLAADVLIFGLRRNAGVDLGTWRTRFPEIDPVPIEHLAATWVHHGLAECHGQRLWLTDEGRLRVDAVGLAILEHVCLRPAHPTIHP